MVLKFKFWMDYSNGVVEKVARRVAEEVGVKWSILYPPEGVELFVEGSVEGLTLFSNRLGEELPLSIFIDGIKVEAAEELPPPQFRPLPALSLPPCPRCLREVKDPAHFAYCNPFHRCEVCGYRVKGEWEFNRREIGEVEGWEQFWEKVVAKLGEEGEIILQTMTGLKRITTNLEGVDRVVAKDLGEVAALFHAFEGDEKGLASIEKPALYLLTSLQFKKRFNSTRPAYWVQLPDDLILELLFFKGDFSLLGIESVGPEFGSRALLRFEVEEERPLKGVVTETAVKKVIVTEGERGLYPHLLPLPLKGEVVFSRFKAVGDEEKVEVAPVPSDSPSSDSPICDRFDVATAGFMGVRAGWKLEEKGVVGYSLYKTAPSRVVVDSPKTGFINYLEFQFHFSDGGEVLAQIAQMNETGKRLASNFQKREPELVSRLLQTPLNSHLSGLYYLWGVVGVVIGVAESVEEGAKKVVELANSTLTKKGPRIDYRVQNQKLDPLWVIRTAISFKLAGVEPGLLCYGVLESGAEFLSNIYDTLNREVELEGAILVGDLLEGVFLNKLYTYIAKNYRVYTPRGLGVSGGVEALGYLSLANRFGE